jgi:hypothetical protein
MLRFANLPPTPCVESTLKPPHGGREVPELAQQTRLLPKSALQKYGSRAVADI